MIKPGQRPKIDRCTHYPYMINITVNEWFVLHSCMRATVVYESTKLHVVSPRVSGQLHLFMSLYGSSSILRQCTGSIHAGSPPTDQQTRPASFVQSFAGFNHSSDHSYDHDCDSFKNDWLQCRSISKITTWRAPYLGRDMYINFRLQSGMYAS